MRLPAACKQFTVTILVILYVFVPFGLADEKCSRCAESQCVSDGQCTLGCKDGYFTEHCNRTCRSQCRNRACAISKQTGSPECIHGCVPGFRGVYCELPCRSRCAECTYSECLMCEEPWAGQNCDIYCEHCESMSCFENGTCKARSVCNTRCSRCSSSGVCRACHRGYYGNDCNKNCSDACVGRACSKDSGRCVEGCQPGWTGSTCETRFTYSRVGHQKLSQGHHGYGDVDQVLTSISTSAASLPPSYREDNINKEATILISVVVAITVVLTIISAVVMKMLFCNKCKNAPLKVPWQHSDKKATTGEPVYDEIKECQVLTPHVTDRSQGRSQFGKGRSENNVYLTPVKSSDERQSESNIYLTPAKIPDSAESEKPLLNPEEHIYVDVSNGTKANDFRHTTIINTMTSEKPANGVGMDNDAFRLSPKHHRKCLPQAHQKWTARMEVQLPESQHLTMGRASPITV